MTFQEWLDINELFVVFQCRQSYDSDGYLCVDDKLQPLYCKIRQYGHAQFMEVHEGGLMTSLVANGNSFDNCIENLFNGLRMVKDDDSLSLKINNEHIKLPKQLTLDLADLPGIQW